MPGDPRGLVFSDFDLSMGGWDVIDFCLQSDAMNISCYNEGVSIPGLDGVFHTEDQMWAALGGASSTANPPASAHGSGVDQAGSTVQNPSKSYGQALFALGEGVFYLNGRDLDGDCEGVMSKLGITEDRWRYAVNTIVIRDGLGTNQDTTMSSMFWGAPTQALRDLGDDYGDQTVGEYFRADPGRTAVAQLGHNLVFVAFSRIDAINPRLNASIMMHEALHNTLGMTDDIIKARLGLSGPSHVISDLIFRECF